MDFQRFLNAELTLRTAEVEVPELAEWFPAPEKPAKKGQRIAPPKWKVRALTGSEIAWAKDAHDKAEKLAELLRAAVGDGKLAEALRNSLGLNADNIHPDTVMRMEMLSIASVDPVIGDDNREVVVRLQERYPLVLKKLTDTIYSLIGQGPEVGKRKPSGETPA